MATIARMVVEMVGDASQLRRTFSQVTRDANGFGKQLRDAINNTGPLVSSLKASVDGRNAGTRLIESLQASLTSRLAAVRESVARGLITDREGTIAGHEAAVHYNRALLAGIADLRARKMLPADVHAQLVRELNSAGTDAGRAAREAIQQQLATVGQTLSNIGSRVSSAGRTATFAVTAPIVGAGVLGVKEAADAAESLNKFQVIFGRTSQQVNQQIAALHSTIPATTAQLQDQASAFGGLLQSMGYSGAEAARMSVRLVRLGGDLTSLHNIPVQETMQRLFSGLVGETEAVRRLGVDISEVRLKVLAHNAGLGDNVQALSRAQRTQLIFNEILRATANAHGDAAATAASASNQFRFLQRDATEAAIAFGQRLLPTVIPLVQALSRVLVTMSQLSPRTLDLIIKVGLFAAAVGPLLIVLGSLISAVGAIASVLGALAPALIGATALLAGPAGWILAIGAATAAVLGFIAANTAAAPSVDALANSMRGLTTLELSRQLTQGAADILKLRQEAEQLRARIPQGATAPVAAFGSLGSGAGGARGAASDPAVIRDLERFNELTRAGTGIIAQQQARLDALGVSINRNSEDANKQAAELERIMQRSDAAAKAMLAGLGANTLANAAAAKQAAKELRETLQTMAGQASSLDDLRTQGEAFGQSLYFVGQQALTAFNRVQGMLTAHGDVFDATTARLLNMKAQLLKFSEVARAEALRTLDVAKLIQQTPNAEQARVNRQLAQGAQNVTVPNLPPVTVLPVRPGAIIPNGPNERGPVQLPRELNEHVERFRLAINGMLAALGTSREQLAAFARSVATTVRSVVDGVRPLLNIGRSLVTLLPAQVREAASVVVGELRTMAGELGDRVRAVFAPIGTAMSDVAGSLGARLKPAIDLATAGLNVLATATNVVRQVYQPLAAAVLDVVNPLTFFGGVMQEVAGVFRSLFAPQSIQRRTGETDEDFGKRERENQTHGINALLGAIGRLTRIVSDTLGPVFEALAPVVDALAPVIRAVMQVLAPILAALAPLFRALVPILEALFPIFKLVAIAATYVAQAFGIVAAVVLRAVGNIIIGLGKIVEAFARAVDALPFVSAKGAIRTAEGIQNFGRALLHSADEMNAMANAMAHAREDIRNVGLEHAADDATDSVENMADAARIATESLSYVPQIFRYRARLVETWTPRDLSGGVPAMAGPNDTRPSIPGGDTFIVQRLEINEAESGKLSLDELRRTARRESMATYGTTERAGDMLR